MITARELLSILVFVHFFSINEFNAIKIAAEIRKASHSLREASLNRANAAVETKREIANGRWDFMQSPVRVKNLATIATTLTLATTVTLGAPATNSYAVNNTRPTAAATPLGDPEPGGAEDGLYYECAEASGKPMGLPIGKNGDPTNCYKYFYQIRDAKTEEILFRVDFTQKRADGIPEAYQELEKWCGSHPLACTVASSAALGAVGRVWKALRVAWVAIK